MGRSKVQLFTSPTCPYCPGAKKLVQKIVMDREDTDLEEFSSASVGGMRQAREYGIHGVPTILVSGPAFSKTLIVDPITENNLTNAILVTQGKRDIRQKKSLSQKMKEFFT